ncbi:MAG: hypothetical protein WC842_04005 [Candidatus Paceibacterota bacterium]|jgi:hypothetical protein
MESEPVQYEVGDRVKILPTPQNVEAQKQGKLKGLELDKEYVVSSSFRVWKKWVVSVELEDGQDSMYVNGTFFAKK